MEYSIWAIIWGILVYSIGIKWLERRGIIPKYIRSQGPIHTIHTEKGRRLLEKLASPKDLYLMLKDSLEFASAKCTA